ncbi:hypothetical protein NDU88_005985 [Pleurodeles waltl]|uniref:Uncharacterized protein n=1 Tax=Pleurodeles waltl TaxID=8319 RepID=A0AAV7N000_PLEWA|nr:hypothetical protein NDU88_005985 [Pleurodeles waltl]
MFAGDARPSEKAREAEVGGMEGTGGPIMNNMGPEAQELNAQEEGQSVGMREHSEARGVLDLALLRLELIMAAGNAQAEGVRVVGSGRGAATDVIDPLGAAEGGHLRAQAPHETVWFVGEGPGGTVRQRGNRMFWMPPEGDASLMGGIFMRDEDMQLDYNEESLEEGEVVDDSTPIEEERWAYGSSGSMDNVIVPSVLQVAPDKWMKHVWETDTGGLL